MLVNAQQENERVKNRLRGWYKLARDIDQLTKEITKGRSELNLLKETIHASNIVNYQNLDMPFGGSGPADPVGERVARILDDQGEVLARLLRKETKLAKLRQECNEIESAVNTLDMRDSDIVTRFFLNKEPYRYICLETGIRKTRFYEIIEQSIETLADKL